MAIKKINALVIVNKDIVGKKVLNLLLDFSNINSFSTHEDSQNQFME